MFLKELLCREGLGDFMHHPQCARCVQALQPQVDRIFRCTHCGDYLQCEACLRSEHKAHPLHVIKEWNCDFWCRTNVFSSSPNVDGQPSLGSNEWLFSTSEAFLHCNYGPAAVHSASPATLCDSYWLMAGVGNVNVHDFVGTLERLTDPTRVDATPDRYKAFFRMHRQHAYLMRGKRSGRAHERGGLEGTGMGGLAVSCWACSQPGRNLPDGWKLVTRSHQYLYKLMISVDANFRLKN
ncbi:hypothetical protein C8F01DRAFT_1377356 [Mycena amicta]|nr:hypothetical protein C8F01DRAFT_1377356 [Mycena amicta]